MIIFAVMEMVKQKVALVTGGVRGIGKAVVEKLASEGADVAFTGRSSQSAVEEFEKYITESYGVKAKGYLSDASSFEQASELVENTIAQFGRIDILVNNAGISKDGMLMRMSETQWDDVIAVNLKSVFNLTRAASYYMLKARQGSIINMSSVVGMGGNAGQANYAASKAGVIGLTKSLAKEFGSRGIRVNAVAPGFIATDMTAAVAEATREEWVKNIPLKREGHPEDVANTVLFLASDLSSYITGQVIAVCGGMSI